MLELGSGGFVNLVKEGTCREGGLGYASVWTARKLGSRGRGRGVKKRGGWHSRPFCLGPRQNVVGMDGARRWEDLEHLRENRTMNAPQHTLHKWREQ